MTAAGQPRNAWALLTPALVVFALAFVAPMFRLGWMSALTMDSIGVLHDTLSAANYRTILASGYHLGLIRSSLVFGVGVSVAALVLAYPAALFLHQTTSRWRSVLLLAALAPLFVSSIVRTYGWALILGPEGVINSLVQFAAPGQPPLRLLNNVLGATIGMIQILLPYMVLSLLSGFGRLTPEHHEAARTLGAGPLRRFLTVTIPLTAPGMLLGGAVCFVLAISSFVTPLLLGGGRAHLLATEIYNQAIVQLEWPLAASLSVILLVCFGGLLALYNLATARLDASAR